MAYALGIDIGTTFSSAAVAFDDGRVELVNLGGRAPSIPSVIVVREQGDVLVGEAAEARAAMDPTRVAREFKRRLGDEIPLILGSTPYSPEALTSILLRHITDFVARRMDGPPDPVVITHPASYTAYRLDLLRNAAVEAGIPNPQLLSEPHAAATQYESTGRVATGEVVAVYDFGGGTFDVALLRHGASGFELIGAPVGVDRLGGIDFDLAIMEHVNDEIGGQLERLDPRDEQTMQILAKLRRDSREAKESLSSDDEAVIAVIAPGTNRNVRVTRALFESMIRPRLDETFGALRRAVAAAGIEVEDIGRVVLVGGSSRIPLIREEVRVRTGRPVAEDVDPEHAVALGAARFAGRSLPNRAPAVAPAPAPFVPAEAVDAPRTTATRRTR